MNTNKLHPYSKENDPYYQRKLDWIKRNKWKVDYNSAKQSAKKRKIEWNFTLESWSKVWLDSDKWEQKGRKAEQYQMCRYNDVGPYSPENVFIATCKENRAMQKVASGEQHWNWRGK